MWKFTWDRAFPHAEIHQKLWISQRAEKLIFWFISTCGNSSGKVNFRMSIYKRIREFPQGKTCGNTRFFGDFHMRKCEFPRAEIHAERYITACGNTLNQVQKKVYLRLRINRRYIELPHAEIHYLMWIPSWGKVYYLMRIYTRKCEFPKKRKFTKIQFSAYEDIHL